MNIAYIMNCINKSEITIPTTLHNFKTAMHPIEQTIFTDNGSSEKNIKAFIEEESTVPIFNEENIGNPQALNNAMELAFYKYDCDAVLIMGNDIEMTNRWLAAAVRAYNDIEKTGLIGWSWRGNKSNIALNGHNVDMVMDGGRVFGSWFLPRTTFDKCGYFSEFSKYGCWDSTYNVQVSQAGLHRYYLCDFPSKHITGDEEFSQYRRLKDDELIKGAEGNMKRMEEIKKTGKNYVTRDGILR